MREILFRGKAINRNKGYHRTKYKNGDWVFGLLTRKYDEQFENLPAEMTNTDGVSGIEIDHKTIGQYTGLTDKNSKKIFGGDIVKVCRGKDVEIGVVKCDERFAAYIVSFDKGKSCLLFFDIWQGIQEDNRVYIEVIGNIHDNPELLKGGAE